MPACLPRRPATPGRRCTVVGWGKRHANDLTGSRRLREARLPLVPRAKCLRSYRRYTITDNMFCAGWRAGGQDTCAGDSGGGLVCPSLKTSTGSTPTRYTVQGITSFGDGCGKRGKYGIYVNVHNYIDWIKYIMRNR